MKEHAVFIQTNHKQIVGALVAEYALRRNSRHNDDFQVLARTPDLAPPGQPPLNLSVA